MCRGRGINPVLPVKRGWGKFLIQPISLLLERWGRDLNPRGASTSGFRDRRLGPSLATPANNIVTKKFNQRLFYIPIDSMNIKVKISRTNETKQISIEKGLTVEDVLKKINLKPDTVIIINKSKPIPIDEVVKDGEELTIIQVSSGG